MFYITGTWFQLKGENDVGLMVHAVIVVGFVNLMLLFA